jgi:glycolate oxidase iron-sulfur subunit
VNKTISIAAHSAEGTNGTANILNRCTNCGCCISACPTYEVTGDERESPRGRINLVREMLASPTVPSTDTVEHLDNCLTCLACMTACPSGVDYGHLIDHARDHIETHHARPIGQRLWREILLQVLPEPSRFRAATTVARWFKPIGRVLEGTAATRPLAAMLAAVPDRPVKGQPTLQPGTYKPTGEVRRRVLLLLGCVQPTLDPGIDIAAVELLTGLGVEVIVPQSSGCCGALNQHLGRREAARNQARQTIDTLWPHLDGHVVDAILTTASGCGTSLSDYAHLLQGDASHARQAERVAALVMDLSALLVSMDLPAPRVRPGLRVAYHAACSLQHGLGRLNEAKELLRRAGFTVLSPKDEHLCCGSAGTYSLLKPDMANELRRRKLDALGRHRPDVIAGGNIGCLQHLAVEADIPVLHTVELLRWAWSGARPDRLATATVESADEAMPMPMQSVRLP